MMLYIKMCVQLSDALNESVLSSVLPLKAWHIYITIIGKHIQTKEMVEFYYIKS